MLAACLLANLIHRASADEKTGVAFFEQHVRPVLVKHCYACHSEKAEKLKGGLLLDSRSGWQRGGDSGDAAIVPGKPEQSLLISSIRHEGGLEMPPGTKLPAADIANLAAWIKMGAPDPRVTAQPQLTRADKTWWSLQPLAAAPPPLVKGTPSAWQEHPIDRFIYARLQQQNLQPNPPAEARSLIRRMTYNVIGLPPTPEEVESFAKNYALHPQQAVEDLIDRLLASPHYGEHWGRHWLDVIRFGESIGFERNVIIDDLWPFRDYVIQSFNDDKPFNRFIVEHLAGDVIGKDQPEVEIGSAFLVAGPYDDVGNQDVVAKANIRAATLDDPISATGSAFLGLTVNCARCHHHKFDPVPTEDYYRIRAAFEGIQHGRRVVASPEERAQYAAATGPLEQQRGKVLAERDSLEKQLEIRAREELPRFAFARPKVDPQWTEEHFDPVKARHVKFIMHAHTGNPKSAVGSRLVEFEVWSAGENSQNVALASRGGLAQGPKSATAEDFPDAYGPQFTNDGLFAEQWFIGSPAELTVTLPFPQSIDRIAFANSRGLNVQRQGIQGETPCEYEILVSLDGRAWTTVANSLDRQPWSEAHALEQARQKVITAEERLSLARLDGELANIDRHLRAVPPLRQVWVGNHVQPNAPTQVHQGGDPMKPGEVVTPASLSVLSEVLQPFELPIDAPEGERRLALARWIASDDNPLTSRVLANRLWQYHFGVGIVDTPSDFGFLGSQPTHPELLDWLAGRLIALGWRLKPLHREILLSQTYRQSSAFSAAAEVDRDSRLLWRFPPRRLSAEEVRDTILKVSGKLDTRFGGPGFRLYKFTQNNVCTYFPLDRHGPETYRRAVYHQNARASVVDLLTDFDFPDIAFAAPVRANTTTPLQALTLLNHKFTLEMAAALTNRVSPDGRAHQSPTVIDRMYRWTLQRTPTQQEREAAAELIRQYGAPALARAILNLNELIYLD